MISNIQNVDFPSQRVSDKEKENMNGILLVAILLLHKDNHIKILLKQNLNIMFFTGEFQRNFIERQ